MFTHRTVFWAWSCSKYWLLAWAPPKGCWLKSRSEAGISFLAPAWEDSSQNWNTVTTWSTNTRTKGESQQWSVKVYVYSVQQSRFKELVRFGDSPSSGAPAGRRRRHRCRTVIRQRWGWCECGWLWCESDSPSRLWSWFPTLNGDGDRLVAAWRSQGCGQWVTVGCELAFRRGGRDLCFNC